MPLQMPLQIHRSCGEVFTACCHVALALPICHCAAEQLSQFWKRWQQLSQQQSQEHWKAQDVRLLSVGAGSASMAETMVLNLSSKRQVAGKVLEQPSASTEFLGKTDQIFGCLCRVQLKVTTPCPSTRIPAGERAILVCPQLSVVRTDQTVCQCWRWAVALKRYYQQMLQG